MFTYFKIVYMDNITFKLFLFIFLAGGIGATLRGFILYLYSKYTFKIPYAIVTVNCLATFFTIYLGLSLPLSIAFPLISGFCVALGTLSTLCSDCIIMLRQKRFFNFVIYLFLNASLGLLSAKLALSLYDITGALYVI